MASENGQPSVLIIDDEETIIKMAGQRLRHSGYAVLSALSSTEGLTLARSRHPDVILLDLMMPVMNGAAVLRALKAEAATRHIPVIMLTASGAEEEITNAISLGAICYLTKPYQAYELLEEVKMALERHRLSHEGPTEAAGPQA